MQANAQIVREAALLRIPGRVHAQVEPLRVEALLRLGRG